MKILKEFINNTVSFLVSTILKNLEIYNEIIMG